MGCNDCVKKSRQLKARQQIARGQAARRVRIATGLTAKEYLQQLSKNKK